MLRRRRRCCYALLVPIGKIDRSPTKRAVKRWTSLDAEETLLQITDNGARECDLLTFHWRRRRRLLHDPYHHREEFFTHITFACKVHTHNRFFSFPLLTVHCGSRESALYPSARPHFGVVNTCALR